MAHKLSDSVTTLSGVGPKRAASLEKLGIETVKDLLYLFPRAYERRGDIRLLGDHLTETNASYLLTVAGEVRNHAIKRGLTLSKFRAFDESGSCEITFFNAPFVKDVFHTGMVFRFFGKASFSKTRTLVLTNPKYEPYVEGHPLPDFVPVYPLTEGVTSKYIDKLIGSVLEEVLPTVRDPLPEEIRLKAELPTLQTAIRAAHFPNDEAALSGAMRRLAFDEMLLFGLGIAVSSTYKQKSTGIRLSPCQLDEITEKLPYQLTNAQKNAVNEIYRDMVIGCDGKVTPMARILVGDVGSGKTICAVMAIYIAVRSGYQAALMVPTEILADQHYKDVSSLLGSLGIRVELLTGSTKASEKKRIHLGLETGAVDVVIGTHALISDKVAFANLALVVTDEQHRFGVMQRASLKNKAKAAHLLVMSATPIPRTLALTMYGDLDVSRINEMPKGRMRVDTFVVNESYRQRLNSFIEKQVALGGQVYIVCPSIEDKEEGEGDEFSPESINTPFRENTPPLKNAVEYTETLRKALPGLSIETLHGRMKGAEKDEIMKRFSAGEVQILVSTTVIEVGVNVPNACLMVIENAERFGLSQLHQLRGRVGRGTKKSYCVLVSDLETETAKARLEIMRTTYDGYEIAEKDLILRGPGDFFSSNSEETMRQSGGFNFHFAKLCDDPELFDLSFRTAKEILSADPKLADPEHEGLKELLGDAIEENRSTLS